MNGRKYTQEEMNFLHENYPTKGIEFCQEKLNIPNALLKAKIIRMGLKLNLDFKKLLYKKVFKDCRRKKNNEYSVNPEQFYDIKTPEVAYILGLLWADGYILDKSRNEMPRNLIKLAVIKEDFDYFLPIFNQLGNWKTYIRTPNNKKPQGHIEASNRPLVEFLVKYDYRAKSSASACKILSIIPDNLKHFWYLGFIDGDGCFYMTPNKKSFKLCISSSHNQDWTFIENQLKLMNIDYKIKRYVRKNGSSSICQICSRSGFINFGDWLYSNHQIGLPRKRNKFFLMKEEIKNCWNNMLENKGITYRKTKNIYEIYEILEGNKKYIGSAKTFELAKLKRLEILGF